MSIHHIHHALKPPTRIVRLLRWLTVCTFLWQSHIVQPGDLRAADGIDFLLPQGKSTSGITIEVYATWVESPGYRPVRMEITCTAKPFDRTLRLEVMPNSWSAQYIPKLVVSSVELPAGSSKVSHTVLIPNPVDGLRIEASLDGTVLKDVSQQGAVQMNANLGSSGYASNAVSLLLVDTDMQTLSPGQTQASWTAWLDRSELPDIRLLGEVVAENDRVPGTMSVFAGNPPFGGYGGYGGGISPLSAQERLFQSTLRSGVSPETSGQIVSWVSAVPLLVDGLRTGAGRWLGEIASQAGKSAGADAGSSVNNGELLRWIGQRTAVHAIAPANLPAETLGLSAVDIVVISLDDLLLISGRRTGWGSLPADAWRARERALLNHVRLGGTLLVYDVGRQRNRLPELDQILQAAAADEPGWQELDPNYLGSTFRPFQSRREVEGTEADLLASLAANARRLRLQLNRQAEGLRWRGLGFGRVLAVGTGRLQEVRSETWHWLLVCAGNEQISGASRRDLAWTSNQSYWQYAIPGTLQAPVGGFLLTIGLFVIAVGPVNALALRRLKRLYLLPATVIGISLVTVVTLVVFAICDDGIVARSRVVSFTRIDQPARNSWSVSRQNYYAAFAPSRGLEFPANAELFHVTNLDESSDQALKRVERSDEQRQSRFFQRDYMASRTNSQFLVLQSQKTDLRLQVQEDSASSAWAVTNQLGARLRHLWVVDSQGKLHYASGVAPLDSAKLAPSDEAAFKALMAHALNGREVTMPPAFFGWIPVDMPRSWRGQSNGMLEDALQASARFASPPQPRTYLAIAETAPRTLPIGMSAREEHSFHIIRGNW